MPLIIDTNKCIGCGLCVTACDLGVLIVNNKAKLVAGIECNECGECMDVCPEEAITSDEGNYYD
jgi:NAD-dependent dihydropyrimidine dehydrogenase PreA subunit